MMKVRSLNSIKIVSIQNLHPLKVIKIVLITNNLAVSFLSRLYS